MYLEDIINLSSVSISYFLLIIMLSALILKPKVMKESIFKRFTIYIIFGNFYIAMIIFALVYLRILNRTNLLITISVFSVLIRMVLDKGMFKDSIARSMKLVEDLIIGRYGAKYFIYVMGGKLKRRTSKFLHELFDGKKIEWTVFVIIVAYNAYQYGINSIKFLTYMAPDEEVHLYWIQSLIVENIFPSGVYPHIFHNVIAAIVYIFKLNELIVLRYFGIVSCVLIMTMLYGGLRKIFKSKYSALFGFLIYSTLNLYSIEATYRFQFAIPQEYGMMMLMPMAIFFFDYLKSKKNMDLILFGLSLSLAIGIHFYTGIIAIILTLCIVMVYLYQIIKEKSSLKILLVGVLSGVIAITPLATGVALGYEMEQSMSWATDVIKGNIYKENKKETHKEKIEEDEEDSIDQPFKWSKFKFNVERSLAKHVVMNIKIMYILLSIIIATIIFNIIFIYSKKSNEKIRYKLIFAINSLLLFSLMLFRYLKLPTIMETKRLGIYFAYFSPIFLGMPLELVFRYLKSKSSKKVIPIISLATMAAIVYLASKYNYLRPLPPLYYFQTTGTMKTNMKIMEQYEDYTWTAVSPVNNISGIFNHGYHYELSDFIKLQEDWNREKEIKIPTEYVFIYIEKRPITKFGAAFKPNDPELRNRERIKEEDGYKEFTTSSVDNKTYTEERSILMAKAYYWAETYERYFPKEMNVYYEDSELIVYRIKQNIYALNNFSIDYEMNKK